MLQVKKESKAPIQKLEFDYNNNQNDLKTISICDKS